MSKAYFATAVGTNAVNHIPLDWGKRQAPDARWY